MVKGRREARANVPRKGDRRGPRLYIVGLMQRDTGMAETVESGGEARRKRLRFRAWHRGFKEADLIFGHFADERLETLDEDQLAAFERLLEVPDQDAFDWILGRSEPPPEHDTDVLAMLRDLRYFARTLWNR